MLHRTFTAAVAEATDEQPTFTFRGHHFVGVPVGEVPAAVMLDMVAADQQRTRSGTRDNSAELIAGFLSFVMSCLTEDSAEEFHTLIRRPWSDEPLPDGQDPEPGWIAVERPDGRRQVWRVVRDEELEEIARWLTEVYAGVPTRPSSASSPASSAVGASSRAASTSAGSAPSGSPQPYARVRDLEAEARAARAEAAGASSTGQPAPSSTSA